VGRGEAGNEGEGEKRREEKRRRQGGVRVDGEPLY